MNGDTVYRAVLGLLRELLDGPSTDAAFVLNPRDPGLLRSLEMLSGDQASAAPAFGGASIAAHVDHLRYGFALLNRWVRGEQPFADAEYSASWQRGTVSDAEWTARLRDLRSEADKWREALAHPRDVSGEELTGIVSSVVHLAYHFGAIRQIDRSIRGPAAQD